jgi:hypothetical protein
VPMVLVAAAAAACKPGGCLAVRPDFSADSLCIMHARASTKSHNARNERNYEQRTKLPQTNVANVYRFHRYNDT